MLEFVPRVSIGPFVFRQGSQDAITAGRKLFGEPTQQAKDIVRFHDNAVLFEFDNDALVFVEVALGAGVDIRLNGTQLGSLTDTETSTILGTADEDDNEYPATFSYSNLSMTLWRPVAPIDVLASRADDPTDDPDFWAQELERASRFRTLAVAVPGYWD